MGAQNTPSVTLFERLLPLGRVGVARHRGGCKDSRRYIQHCRMANTRDRVREHRRRLRAQGLRPVQIWVPDVRATEFVAEAHRQSMAIAASEGESDDPVFVDAISVEAGDPESAE